MNVCRRVTRRLLGFLFAGGIVIASALYIGLYLSLEDKKTEGFVQGLTEDVWVTTDQFGIPTITTASHLDGFRALGFVTAGDRLFQMDLLRRRSAGRLAEIFGDGMLGLDKEQRILGFEKVARDIAQRLPAAQREVLEAYAEGINSAVDGMSVMPFEFLVLGYRPERWRIEDSLLIVLSMFQDQSDSANEERMLSVMEQALPADVYEFLTPMTDPYSRAALGEEFSADDYQVPVESLVSMLKQAASLEKQSAIVQPHRMRAASNAWAVAGTKTKDGRAILANDMHTSISVPNIWYRCRLRLGENDIAGVSLPGTPLIVAGASRHLAWGMTALVADVLDLVKIQVNPDDHNEYWAFDGWKPFEVRRELIRIKGGETHEMDVRMTLWGPVARKLLVDQPVAIRWTALDATAVNIGWLDIYAAKTLEAGMAVVNNTGGPPLNVILADDTGRIAWTTMGRLPLRRGFDGIASRSWSDGSAEWMGYVLPEQLPRIIDPSAGFVVNANNRGVDRNYPFTVGHAFANGYRAYRIAERLQIMNTIDEDKMFRLQLDTKAGVYGYYRDIALQVLNSDLLTERPELQEMRNYLAQWDGHADVESSGFIMLTQFRMALAKALLEPVLQACRRLDEEFEYGWAHLDIPLQALLREKNLDLLPNQEVMHYSDWDAFLLTVLEQTAQKLITQYPIQSLSELTWGKVNIAAYVHPLSQGIPGIASLLDLPRDSLPGCDFCIRVNDESFGATERLVISPRHWEDGILHMPGGQSGHPLSKHYKDQHRYWVNGQAIRFALEAYQHSLKLMPAVRNHHN